ncbi:hypothetical protein BDW72DRAFT_177059 [Aspergillus terricola var. indicus]
MSLTTDDLTRSEHQNHPGPNIFHHHQTSPTAQLPTVRYLICPRLFSPPSAAPELAIDFET